MHSRKRVDHPLTPSKNPAPQSHILWRVSQMSFQGICTQQVRWRPVFLFPAERVTIFTLYFEIIVNSHRLSRT